MDNLFIVQAVDRKSRVILKTYLVKNAEDWRTAEEKIRTMNIKESAEGEPMFPLGCDLVTGPVEFEVNSIEEIQMRDPILTCTCRTVIEDLDCPGGQYQYTWFGKCQECGQEWKVSSEVDEEV